MSQAKQAKPSERRGQQRAAVRVPVAIKAGQSTELSGHTRDLSTNGIFLYTDTHLAEGSELELVLILPAELTGGQREWACCRASVVRVEQGGKAGKFGIAATIDSFDRLPEISG
jgi:hypothetical protein